MKFRYVLAALWTALLAYDTFNAYRLIVAHNWFAVIWVILSFFAGYMLVNQVRLIRSEQ